MLDFFKRKLLKAMSTLNICGITADHIPLVRKNIKKEKARSCPFKMAVGGRTNDSDSCHLLLLFIQSVISGGEYLQLMQ